MGLQRLDDAELGRRVRARNRDANAAMRERLANAGKRQTNVWLSAALRERLDALAMDQGAPLSEIAEQVLSAGIAALAAPSLPVTLSPPVVTQSAPESLPLFEPASTGRGPAKPAKANPDYSERDRLIVELHGQGVSYRQIAARLAEQGHLSANGTPLSIGQIGRILERTGLKKG